MLKPSSEVIEYVRRHLENNKINTTERTYGLSEHISYPQLFRLLAKDQQQDALVQLSALPLSTQQLLLDEWQARCLSQDIRNPAGYLFGMIRKAQLGTFRVTRFGYQDKN